MSNEELLSRDWGLKPLHNKMLEMLKYLHVFCGQNAIEYCLAYGTTLGAIRHQGFIPWDDDVDIYMSAKSYRIFKEKFLEKGDLKHYYLQELDSIDGMVTLSKLRINHTTYIEPLYRDSGIHQGIYLDIFILHTAPAKLHQKIIMYISNQYLVLKGLSNRGYSKKYKILLNFLRMLPKNFGRRLSLRQVYKYNEKISETVFDVDLRTYKRSFYRKNLVFPAVKVLFEGMELYVPAQYDKYLKMVYGNYMVLPSLENVLSSQHAMNWDISTDYRDYLLELRNKNG